MSKRDYYEVLGVDRNDDSKALKKAYRQLTMKYHPDRNPGDKKAEAKFKEVNEAYEVLKDDQKRSAYDQFGHAAVDGSAGGRQSSGAQDFSDIFGDIFGGGSRQRGPQPGNDLRYDLELSLEEAVKGTSKDLRVPTLISCDTCHGSGAKPGTSVKSCSTCGGHGQVKMQQGFFSVQQTCPTCRGQGSVIKDMCRPCQGRGIKNTTKQLSVKIPPGVDTGDRIRLSGEGEAGEKGAPSGDLYVQIQVRNHPIFVRKDRDLHCDVPINIVDASLGGDIEVPTLDGRIKLKIPAETQNGKLFRLRGRGVISVRNKTPGDLLCRVQVETPVKLTEKQKSLLKEFQASLKGDKQYPRKKGWFDGVKTFFENI